MGGGGGGPLFHYSRIFAFCNGVLEPNPREKGGLRVLREAYMLGSSCVAAFPVSLTALNAPANHVEKVHFLVLEAGTVEEVCNSKSCKMEFDSANGHLI